MKTVIITVAILLVLLVLGNRPTMTTATNMGDIVLTPSYDQATQVANNLRN